MRLRAACGAAIIAAAPLGAQVADSTTFVTTHHRVLVGGHEIAYTARAGRLPIRVNETGSVHGWVFFTAYTVDRAPGTRPRPLTMLWNGGPGANSQLVHLIGFGPRRVVAPDPNKPNALAVRDNEFSWLDATDLVFVDPVGTGYSRLTHSKYAGEFFGAHGDIASITEFVRVYLTHFDAWRAPLFVGGESYGVWRAAGVAEALERRGIRVAGEILISGGMPVLAEVPYDLKAALFLPTRSAAALYFKKLAPDLQADPAATLANAAQWARDEYAPALARTDSLSGAQRRAIVLQLSRYTGLDTSLIDGQTLIVKRGDFARQLLADQHLVLGRFDARLTTPVGGAPASPLEVQRGALTVRYFRTELGYLTDLAYLGSEAGYTPAVLPRAPTPEESWVYDQNAPDSAALAAVSKSGQVRRSADDGPPNGPEPWLRRAMILDPSLKAFVAVGMYDSLNSCAWNDWLVASLEAPFRQNITAKCYVGGHMMYEDDDARRQLKADVVAFIREVAGGR